MELHGLPYTLCYFQLELSVKLKLQCSFPVYLQYPPGYLAAMANKTKKEACARPGRGGRSKHYPGRGRPRRQRKIKEKVEEDEDEDEEEEDEQPVASMEEDGLQSNGEQKTAKESGGCFNSCISKQVRQSVVKRGQVRKALAVKLRFQVSQNLKIFKSRSLKTPFPQACITMVMIVFACSRVAALYVLFYSSDFSRIVTSSRASF